MNKEEWNYNEQKRKTKKEGKETKEKKKINGENEK